ncbi:hypothetical protein NP233_g6610 [Leucocoprinus birnbaumii]|uniref:Uncharacterized protein n=1 Tax=Leucocoprinus birnbaumii TaxID=56174 RepID=A0AAD5VQR9_9AGAR|nr:hypothetical protein NP233_g6610 [Leucocoprinus birnbaumii]
MGRKSANGKPALNDAQVIVLKGLGNEALTARSAIKGGTSPHSTLREWVNSVALPSFNSLYKMPASDYEEWQIYLWFRNYCQRKSAKSNKESEGKREKGSSDNSSGRLKSVRALVTEKHHNEIHAAATASHDGTGLFVKHWNDAVSAQMSKITDSERDNLKKIIETEEESRKSPPAKASIIAEQDAFTGRVTQRVRELLGWERKQFGDAACFLAVTYRDKNNTVQEFRCMISNQPQSLKFYEPFVTHYDQEMGNELAMVSGRVLPRHEVHSLPFIDELPDGVIVLSKEVRLEGFTIIELREMVDLFLRKLWEKSHTDCTADTFPLKDLDNREKWTSLFQKLSAVTSFSTLNSSVMSNASVFKFLEAVSLPDHGISFKPPSNDGLIADTLNVQQLPSTPLGCSPSPDHTRAVESEAMSPQPIPAPLPDFPPHRPAQPEVQPPLNHSNSGPSHTCNDTEAAVSTTPPSSPGRNIGLPRSPAFSIQPDARSANQARPSNSAEAESAVPDLDPRITPSTESANELLPTSLPNSPFRTLSDASNTPPKLPAKSPAWEEKAITSSSTSRTPGSCLEF